MKSVKDYVTTIPDFPEPGIMFRDVTSVLQDADGLHLAIDEMQKLVDDLEFDVVAGAESRGFIFGCPVAVELGLGFVPIRKPGKLPREIIKKEYSLEYGTNTLCMHADALKKGDKVVIIDDLLATGGTINAAVDLVRSTGAEVVGCAFLIELTELKGRENLEGIKVKALIDYPY